MTPSIFSHDHGHFFSPPVDSMEAFAFAHLWRLCLCLLIMKLWESFLYPYHKAFIIHVLQVASLRGDFASLFSWQSLLRHAGFIVCYSPVYSTYCFTGSEWWILAEKSLPSLKLQRSPRPSGPTALSTLELFWTLLYLSICPSVLIMCLCMRENVLVNV